MHREVLIQFWPIRQEHQDRAIKVRTETEAGT